MCSVRLCLTAYNTAITFKDLSLSVLQKHKGEVFYWSRRKLAFRVHMCTYLFIYCIFVQYIYKFIFLCNISYKSVVNINQVSWTNVLLQFCMLTFGLPTKQKKNWKCFLTMILPKVYFWFLGLIQYSWRRSGGLFCRSTYMQKFLE